MRLGLGVAAIAIALSGCASKGLMEPGAQGVSQEFLVNADPMAAFRRASEYVRVCHEVRAHPYQVEYGGKRVIGQRGLPHEVLVHQLGEEAKILERIQVQEAERASQARVKVIVLGGGVWDGAEIAAAKQSIESSTPVCRALE
ncbi:BPTD_2524 family lipoprotein [Bordetella avium]|uniref:Lipoprotein n=1 Tax=Bordetella avium (strain 197N) TaxID=360910 RepID=Q2KYD7_BORA1|nr:hypothetical protein [Bordetella avium]AZY49649.1 hypothetical protein C0J09_11250 [Bordetella avium]AZY53002.1 hypothetical protein C0J07_11230 [Bordetella avium]RIQ11998.1 hypothetical protein D0432_15160 [Bordetella avium]RIQ17695.1 hypothetical protein D0850_09530 [Bordetella avium]RIQ32352.1 hypothetical protein D0849_12575 [Bordetella avium]